MAGSADSAWARFQESLRIGFDQWHDGVGYDLGALSEMTAEQRAEVRRMMATRIADGSGGWREVEAAEVLGDRETLEAAARSPDAITRQRARRALGDSEGTESEVAQGVLSDDWPVFSHSLDLVSVHPTPRVKKALLLRVKQRGEGCVPAGMKLLEVFAGVEDAFLERPMLFRLREEREDGAAYQALEKRVE